MIQIYRLPVKAIKCIITTSAVSIEQLEPSATPSTLTCRRRLCSKMSGDGEEDLKFPASLYTKGTSLVEFNLAAALQNLYAQTDYLRRHQDWRGNNTDECLVDIRAQLESLSKSFSSSSSSSGSSQAEKIPQQPVVKQVIPSAVTDMMKQSEMKITKLESVVYSLQDKLVKHESEAESRTRDLLRSLEQCRHDRSSDLETITDLSSRLQQCEEFIAAHVNIRSEAKMAVAEMGSRTGLEIAEVSREMSGFSALNKRLSESLHLLENRLTLTESQIRSTFETTEHIALKTGSHDTTLTSLSTLLEKMGSEKASRKELSYKADLSLIMTKVDISEVSKFEDALHDLQRHLTSVRAESQDALNALEKTFLKKQESIAMWCVRKVRKELAQAEGGEADIGRVKCLVCDQVVKQMKEQDIVGSGPVYSNTIRPKRQQSAGHSRRRGDSPVGGYPSPATEADAPAARDNKKYDIKLTPIQREGGGKQQAKALSQQAGEWSAQPEEREYVPISADAQGRAAMSSKQTQSQGYFRDLEMKFARGDYVRAVRPMSAV